MTITLRWVERDPMAILPYALDGPRIASVLLFSQEMTARAEADMARMTQAMIEAVLASGGSYYLPYQPHATVDQFRRCYGRNLDFLKIKLEADPRLRLRNALWDNYLDKVFVQ